MITNDQVKFLDVPQHETEYNAWGWKRIVAAVVSGGASEGVAAITHTSAETGERVDKPGGKKWTEKEANKFYDRAPGKVDKIRYVTNRILTTDPNNVKPNHKKDWESLITKSNQIKTSIEERWTLLQDYKNKGFNNESNREEARFNYTKINEMYEWALKADDKRHIWSTVRDIDKVAQGFKTVNLAPIRAMGEVFIRLNVFNIATIFKLASVRKPDEFQQIRLKWKQIGGNRTKFDAAINAGYKKKPILAKPMNISDLKFEGNYNESGPVAPGGSKGSNAATDNQKLQDATQTINQIATNIPQKQADPDKKVLEIPNGVIAAIPALSAAFGATLGASADRAATAAAASAWGGLVSGMFGLVNAMKIPLQKNETQPNYDENLKMADITDAEQETKKVGIIHGIPNYITIPVIGLFAIGATYGIYKIVTHKKK